MAAGTPRFSPFELGVGAATGLALAAAAPLGLDRVAGAPELTAALTFGRGLDGEAAGVPPLAVLVVRAFAALPLGDLATRAHVGAVVCAALGAALVARLATQVLRALAPVTSRADEDELDDRPEPTVVPAAPTPTPFSVTTGRLVPFVRPPAAVPARSQAPGQTRGRERGRANVRRTTPSMLAVGPGTAGGVMAGLPAVGPAPQAAVTPGTSWSDGRVLGARATVDPVDRLTERLAVAAGVACTFGTLAVFLAASTSVASSVTLALVVAAWSPLLGFSDRPGTPRRGLGAAVLAGLALAAGPLAPLLVWPATLLTWARLWRTGERWPAWALVTFAAGAALALPWARPVLAALAAETRAIVDVGVAAVRDSDARAPLFVLVREGVGGFGVVTALVGCVGAAVLLSRRPRWFATGAVAATTVMGLLAARGAAVAPVGWALLGALGAVVVAVGLVRLAGTLGPARAAAALALGVVAAVWPLLDGGAARWRRTTFLPEALLEHAHARLPPGSAVEIADPRLEALLRYGRALGLRPDLTLPEGEAVAPPTTALVH